MELEDQEAETKDRAFWVERSGILGVEIVDECYQLIQEIDHEVHLNYTQSYIGLSYQSKTKNFALFVPKDTYTRISISLPDSSKWVDIVTARKFNTVTINKRNGRLKFRINKENLRNDSKLLSDILKESHEYWFNS